MADTQKKYRVSPRYAYQYPNSVTLVPVNPTDKIDVLAPTVTVALGGKEIVHNMPATAGSPPVAVTIPVATQAQLSYLYNVEKHPFIEEVNG